MPKSTHTHQAHETSALILDAAGRIFAKNGFHATTVRQITRAAGVNLAAVNYHFHDKQELYFRVLKHAHRAAAMTAEADHAGPPSDRLRAFIAGFLGWLLDPQRPEWHGRLIAREMAEPTQALDRLVQESILPVKRRITGIVRDLLGPGVSEEQIHLAACSIMGQCLFYVHCREMVARLFSDKRHAPHDVKVLVDHVYRFSLAGIASARSHQKAKPKSERRNFPSKSTGKKRL